MGDLEGLFGARAATCRDPHVQVGPSAGDYSVRPHGIGSMAKTACNARFSRRIKNDVQKVTLPCKWAGAYSRVVRQLNRGWISAIQVQIGVRLIDDGVDEIRESCHVRVRELRTTQQGSEGAVEGRKIRLIASPVIG